jgi:hypothetical protein
LTAKPGPTKIVKMEAETKEKSGERKEESAPEPTERSPVSELRDLPPEKDPMGAGRARARAQATLGNPARH